MAEGQTAQGISTEDRRWESGLGLALVFGRWVAGIMAFFDSVMAFFPFASL